MILFYTLRLLPFSKIRTKGINRLLGGSMFIILTALVFSFTVSAKSYCPQYEAQVIGKVSGVKHFQNKCKVYANFSDYQVHGLCPLYESEVETEGILLEDEDCDRTSGDPISGYLVRKSGEKTITIE